MFTSELNDAGRKGLQSYQFPSTKLKTPKDPFKTPIALIACGSYSPVTFLHLRMFEMALDHVKFSLKDYEVVGMYLSPVSNAYNKAGLASAQARIKMCQLGVEGSDVDVDPWEALQPGYTLTADVLEHFDYELNTDRSDTTQRPIKACLLAGSDLLDTMRTPGVWSSVDLHRIMARGVFVIERSGVDEKNALVAFSQWREKIFLIPQLIPNEISSTRVRNALRSSRSVKYLVPMAVATYIHEHSLYKDQSAVSRINDQEKLGITASSTVS